MKLEEVFKNLRKMESENYENTETFEGAPVEKINRDDPGSREFHGYVYFVDGVMKNLAIGRYRGFPLVLSQIAIGSVRIRVGEDPEIIPDYSSKLILSLNENVFGDMPKELDFDDFKVFVLVTKSSDPTEAVRSMMEEEEMKLAKEIAKSHPESIVLKDGTLRPIYEVPEEPVFVHKSGPFGLVKNVIDVIGVRELYTEISQLARGRRTKAFKKVYKNQYVQLSTFVKLMEGEDEFVRVDAVHENENLEDILPVFDEIAWIVENLSIPYKIKRYPQNLPVIEYLESFLRAHLLDPRYVVSRIRSSVLP